jgi:lysophospholipase L1-like esterase
MVGWNSLTTAFPRYNVLNRGFGGSQASDVLFFYDRIVPPYNPALILFYEGDNDLASGKSVNQVFADWTNFVGRVERDLPNTHILYLAVKPSPSRAGILDRQRTLNEQIREHTATNPKLHYADTFNAFLTATGQMRPELYVGDQLHLSPAGYAVWESVIVPIVEDWAARSPINVTKTERNGLLIDFGASSSLSGEPDPSVVNWNNITSVGSSDSGALSNLVTAAGVVTSTALKMVSRFNGANENGTTTSTNFPATATRDSLFGNTETFNNLANITPVFNLVGLNPNTAYRLTFYASRTGVGDNRETRYTVSGNTTQFVDLNVANNINNLATVDNVAPDSSGVLNIALTPGPNNNNGNHFTYLGVLQDEALSASGPTFLFDFGSGSSTTGTQGPPPSEIWNNLTVDTGATDDGLLEDLIATNALITEINLQMLSRFNGANESGTSASSRFPASATADSLFGNTELFTGLTNVTPAFKFTGLNPAAIYSLTFFASRTGVGDNRETRYTVTGANTNFTDLDAANNTNQVALIADVRPDSNGEIKIELAPGPNNNNANHFTYLGVLHLAWTVPQPRDSALINPTVNGGTLSLQLLGNPGTAYVLESSTNLTHWSEITSVPLESDPQSVEVPATSEAAFYRVKKP